MTEVLAIIPARGGSKGVLRKNIREYKGKPLIELTLGCVYGTQTVTRVVVSTEDEEIGLVARSFTWDKLTIIPRPLELAQDDTPDLPVFVHALDWLKENEAYIPDIVVHLRPTAPERTAKHIDDCVTMLQRSPGIDSVRTVVQPTQNPYKMWRIYEDGCISPLIFGGHNEPYNMPRQLLPTVYWQNGYVDVVWTHVIRQQNSMTGKLIKPYVMDEGCIVDLDREWSDG